jgi:crossover junction endodeoxyribonuclease RuvC
MSAGMSDNWQMRTLGIDCGTEFTGYGVVEQTSSQKLIHITSGVIRLDKKQKLPLRLKKVLHDLTEIIEQTTPAVVAIEEVFYSVNAKSALKLGQVRGVAMLAAACQGLEVAEYSPLSIKSSVVGYGRAEKSQVQFMVAKLLAMEAMPQQQADAADALAIAICHLHTAATLALQSAKS